MVLPEGDVYYRPYSGHSHHGVTQLDPSPPLHGSARTASGSGTSRSASGQAPGSASSAPAASAAQRERQLNVLNTDDRTVRHTDPNNVDASVPFCNPLYGAPASRGGNILL